MAVNSARIARCTAGRLVARFGYALALNWNIGEENTQSPPSKKPWPATCGETDPYPHHIVVHTFPNRQDAIYQASAGQRLSFTGASLQNSWSKAHQRTLKWVVESSRAGKPWVVANDEQNPAERWRAARPGLPGT